VRFLPAAAAASLPVWLAGVLAAAAVPAAAAGGGGASGSPGM
jgi:hypothetical protein